MARKLGMPLDWDAGVTDSQIRQARIRAAVVGFGAASFLARRSNGSTLTAGMAYALMYGEAP